MRDGRRGLRPSREDGDDRDSEGLPVDASAEFCYTSAMRRFLSERNLIDAVMLSALVTALSIGRFVHLGTSLPVYIPLTMLCMTFVGGAVSAWGRCAGMPGIVTDKRTLGLGSALAALVALIALPVSVVWTDPRLRAALAKATDPSFLERCFPSILGGKLSLVLWSAGFETLFFIAAPASLVARLTNRRDVAVGVCVLLRAFVVHRQLCAGAIGEPTWLFFTAAMVPAAVGSILFARFGLVPAMVFAACMDAHVFVGGR